MSSGAKIKVIITAIIFLAVVFSFVTIMNVKNTLELQDIIRESISNQLISISVAARETLDVDAFINYNSIEDIAANQEEYDKNLAQLRALATNLNVDYIYALKKIGNEYYFIFDTDPEVEKPFAPYELSPVHVSAFEGEEAADTMNVSDEWGNFNTGAIPIWKYGEVVGIISADIEDLYLQKSEQTAMVNRVILIVALLITMAVMLGTIVILLKRLDRMQKRLEALAHYDTVTGLPNRQYLLEYLSACTVDNQQEPFALLFIDLDNFKRVNDNAGHDAGDELLCNIATYLNDKRKDSKVFRPTAGILNIAARVGGDEFIQVVSGVNTQEDAMDVAQGLLDEFDSQVTNRHAKKYEVGLSIGVSLFPYHSENYHVLIKYADIAMYHAKRSGKNCYRIYNDEMKTLDEEK